MAEARDVRLRLAELAHDGAGGDPQGDQRQAVEQHDLQQRTQGRLGAVAVDAVPDADQELSGHPLGGKAGDEDADQQRELAQVEPMDQAGEEAPNLRQLGEDDVDALGHLAQESG